MKRIDSKTLKSLTDLHTQITDLILQANALREDFNAQLHEVVSEGREYYDNRSERWQESEVGSDSAYPVYSHGSGKCPYLRCTRRNLHHQALSGCHPRFWRYIEIMTTMNELFQCHQNAFLLGFQVGASGRSLSLIEQDELSSGDTSWGRGYVRGRDAFEAAKQAAEDYAADLFLLCERQDATDLGCSR